MENNENLSDTIVTVVQPQAEPDPNNVFQTAQLYVKKVKSRFLEDRDVYITFLEILHDYHHSYLTINQTIGEISILFKDHADLMSEFISFLPDDVIINYQFHFHHSINN